MDKRIFIRAVTCFTAVVFFQNLNPSAVLAQECVPADITLSSQVDVDNFQANHGPCNRVSGELSVEGDDILINNASLSDLSALSGLETVAHLLEITWNPDLSDLAGFSNLTGVGIGGGMMSGVLIENNAGLQSLNGLSTIQAASRIYIRHNPSLADCLGINVLIDPIDDYEPGPGPGAAGIPDVTYEVSIHDNSAGCDSVNDSLGKVPIEHLNPGLSDAWFNPETSGQGYFIIIFPMIKQIFLAWFTYDTERPPEEVTAMLGEPGHRWITAQGEYVVNEALLEVWVTHGGTFDSEEPPPERYPDGEILLKFSTCNAGTVTYDIPSIDLQGIVPIQRITLDNVALCYQLNAEAGNETLSQKSNSVFGRG